MSKLSSQCYVNTYSFVDWGGHKDVKNSLTLTKKSIGKCGGNLEMKWEKVTMEPDNSSIVKYPN